MNKVIERGCCAVTWVIERLIIIYVEKWADLIRPLKSEESTESKGSNLSGGGQPYGRSQAFRSDWNSTGTFVTNLEMQCHVLDSAYVRQFLGKNDSNTRYAGLVQCTLQSLVYQVWIASWLLRAFPSAPAEAAGQPWEERSLTVPLRYMDLQYKGENEALYRSLESPKYTRAADEVRQITWLVRLMLVWIQFI